MNVNLVFLNIKFILLQKTNYLKIVHSRESNLKLSLDLQPFYYWATSGPLWVYEGFQLFFPPFLSSVPDMKKNFSDS